MRYANWWNCLDKDDKRILCEHWGTNVQEATHFFLNLKNVSNKKELDLATAARKRLVQQGVEPNPGPQGSRPVRGTQNSK